MKTYEKNINGISHTFILSDEDAEKQGLDPAKDAVDDAAVTATPLAFDTPTTDGEQVEANVAADQAAADARAKAAADADAKARTASNKARTAADK